MFAIAARELRSLFLSPLAWSILAVVQFILAYTFLSRVDFFMQIQGRLGNVPDAPGFTQIIGGSLFSIAGVIMLLVSPLLTMRLISEEYSKNTLPLLISAPLSMAQIIFGKYLGLMGFFLIMLLMLALMPVSLAFGGMLDWGQFLLGLLGLGLLLGAFGAVGLYMSTLTRHPTVAAVSCFGILLLLWIIDWAGESGGQSGLLAYLSITSHFENLLSGIFDSRDIAYYVLIISGFLALSVRRLEAKRLE